MDLSIPDQRAGQIVDGKYRLGERRAALDVGSALAYEGEDLRLGEPVRVFVLTDPAVGGAERVARAVAAMARVAHRGRLPLRDAGPLEDGCPAIVAARSSASPLTPGCFPADALMLALDQALAALEAGHRAKRAHLHLGPTTLLVRPGDGALTLVDLGLGAALPSLADARFAAPEFALGAGPSADIYALGQLWRWLIGRSSTSALLAQALDIATAVEPTARFADASALRAFLAAETGAGLRSADSMDFEPMADTAVQVRPSAELSTVEPTILDADLPVRLEALLKKRAPETMPPTLEPTPPASRDRVEVIPAAEVLAALAPAHPAPAAPAVVGPATPTVVVSPELKPSPRDFIPPPDERLIKTAHEFEAQRPRRLWPLWVALGAAALAIAWCLAR